MSFPIDKLSGEQKAFFEQKAIQSGKVDTYNNFFSRFFAKHFGLSVKVRTDAKSYHVNRKTFESWCQSNNVNEDFSNLKSLNPVAVKYILRAYESSLNKPQNETIRSIIQEFSNLPGSFKCENFRQLDELVSQAMDKYGYALHINAGALWLDIEDGEGILLDIKVEDKTIRLSLNQVTDNYIDKCEMIGSLFESDSFLVDFQEALSNKDAQGVIEFIREEIKKVITPS